MHKSKLAGFIIDCNTADLQAAARFWGNALGMATEQLPGSEGDTYVRLLDPNDQLHIEVQSVNHESRVHLDIETDDIDAEIARLERLGARKLTFCNSWCIMEAPTGQRFCVVSKCSPEFDRHANQWK